LLWSRIVDLLRLRSFVDATRLGSFAAAAKALSYTAPAVSQHVAALEEELGCALVIRGARGVSPTPAGEALQTRAERLLTDAHLAELAVREMTGQLQSLRIGAFPTGAQYLLPNALTALRRDHPDLELTVLHFEPPAGLAELAAGDVDAVLTHRYPGATWTAPTGVRLRPLHADQLNLLTPANHPLAARPQVDISDLRHETFISGTTGTPNRTALEIACAKAHFAPKVIFETAGYGVTTALVAHGIGIALVPALACPPANDSVARIEVRVQGEPLARQISLAHRPAEHAHLLLTLIRHLADDNADPSGQ